MAGAEPYANKGDYEAADHRYGGVEEPASCLVASKEEIRLHGQGAIRRKSSAESGSHNKPDDAKLSAVISTTNESLDQKAEHERA
jgi:hypothetical protein